MSGVARTHRICATRISCAFRIISEEATLVIAGLVPVQELVREAVEVEVTVTTTETNLGETASEREIHLSVVGEMGLSDLWALDPCSHSRLESLAEKEARAGGHLPDPDPEWSRMLPVVPEKVRTRYECRMPILRLWNRGVRA